jgi:hypothetical protein
MERPESGHPHDGDPGVTAAQHAEHRIWGEEAPGVITAGDVSTSPEALRILESKGADAWRVYVAAQKKTKGAGDAAP